MTERLAVIGDLHGLLEPLQEVTMQALGLAERLVFVGDYVNRGPDSAAVIEFLVKLDEETPGTVFLEGHHDRAFRACLEEGKLGSFLQLGGAATMTSYFEGAIPSNVLEGFQQAVPASHRSFLSSLREAFTDEKGLLVVHELPPLGGLEAEGEMFTIAGHSPRRELVPMIEQTFALIDTGCGTLSQGRLTCLLWPSLDWFQSQKKQT